MRALFLFLCLTSFSLYAAPVRPIVVPPSSLQSSDVSLTEEDEVVVVERLVKTTEEQLIKENRLKDIMLLFQAHRLAFAAGDHSKKQASRMVNSAREILEIITDLHIQYLFSTEYLEELKVFSSIAGKNTIKRP